MRTVAQRGFCSGLAATKPDLARLLSRIGHRGQSGAFMCAVTKGLLSTAATGAPIIGFARLDLDGIWGFLGYNWRGRRLIRHLRILGMIEASGRGFRGQVRFAMSASVKAMVSRSLSIDAPTH